MCRARPASPNGARVAPALPGIASWHDSRRRHVTATGRGGAGGLRQAVEKLAPTRVQRWAKFWRTSGLRLGYAAIRGKDAGRDNGVRSERVPTPGRDFTLTLWCRIDAQVRTGRVIGGRIDSGLCAAAWGRPPGGMSSSARILSLGILSTERGHGAVLQPLARRASTPSTPPQQK